MGNALITRFAPHTCSRTPTCTVQVNPNRHFTLIGAMKSLNMIFKNTGLPGLWRGNTLAVARIAYCQCPPCPPLCACLTHLQFLCRPLFLWHSSVICEWRCALRNGTDVRVALTNLGRFQQSPTRPSRCTKWRWPKQTLSDQTRPSPYASLLVQLPERLPRRSHTPWISCGHGSQPTGLCNQGVGRHA